MPLRAAAVTLAALTLVALLALAGVGWYYSSEIHEGVLRVKPPPSPDREVEVLAIGGDTATLASPEGDAEVAKPGIWGADHPRGYGRLGRIVSAGPDEVVREYQALAGRPLRVGDSLDVESTAYPRDPAEVGLEPRAIRYRSDLGLTPAWLFPGSRATWVIFVHGYNSPRSEGLRLALPVNEAGYPAMVISYRNDPGAPKSATGLREWGQSEWRDVEGAVAYALDHGADEVVLAGFSMGGAVVASFLYESELADAAAGAVFDAPALDLSEVIALEGEQRGLPVVGGSIPSPLQAVARTITDWRFGIDFDRVDYVERAEEELSVPALVLHGSSDATVPLRISASLAATRPDLVRLERFAGADHLQSWNVAPRRYERLVLSFLARVAG